MHVDFATVVGAVIPLFVVYKLLDWLLRLPTVGRHADRYVLITGCSSGFGRDLARRLDSRGCHVFATCRKEQDAVELRNVCSSRLRTLIMDVTQPESVTKAFQTVKEELDKDGKELWSVVNNAGTCLTAGPPEWHSIADYQKEAAVNLYGLIDVTMTFLPLIKKSRGRVVNMSSVAGRSCMPGLSSYCVSKYGVEAFTDGLRRWLRIYGCKAILVEPCHYKTELTTVAQCRRIMQKSWDQLPVETKDDFGEAFFRYHVDISAVDVERRLCSDKVSEVTDAYEQAILGRYPRARYPVGLQSLLLWIPLQLLPEWIGDWILERLDSGYPLPAELQCKNRRPAAMVG